MAALLAILLALVSVFVSTRGIPRSVDRGMPGLARRWPRLLSITGWGRIAWRRDAPASTRDRSGARSG